MYPLSTHNSLPQPSLPDPQNFSQIYTTERVTAESQTSIGASQFQTLPLPLSLSISSFPNYLPPFPEIQLGGLRRHVSTHFGFGASHASQKSRSILQTLKLNNRLKSFNLCVLIFVRLRNRSQLGGLQHQNFVRVWAWEPSRDRSLFKASREV